jgi:hypothetical protein
MSYHTHGSSHVTGTQSPAVAAVATPTLAVAGHSLLKPQGTVPLSWSNTHATHLLYAVV